MFSVDNIVAHDDTEVQHEYAALGNVVKEETAGLAFKLVMLHDDDGSYTIIYDMVCHVVYDIEEAHHIFGQAKQLITLQ